MKLKKVLFIIIIIGIVLIPILFYYIGVSDFSQESIYALNWDIQIPSNLKKIYHNQDQHDFQGKGKRYTLLITNETHSLPLIALKNNSMEVQTFEGNSNNGRNYDMEEFIQAIATDLSVPENIIPKFDQYYGWQKFVKNGNILAVLYFPEENLVYFIEKLL
jgi:hypothetical protein